MSLNNGYERDTMLVLNKIRDECTIFQNAYSNAPSTRISASDEGMWLYDLSADPAEQISVADTNSSRVKKFEGWIPEYLVERGDERLSEPNGEVDKEQPEALGYLDLKDQ